MGAEGDEGVKPSALILSQPLHMFAAKAKICLVYHILTLFAEGCDIFGDQIAIC